MVDKVLKLFPEFKMLAFFELWNRSHSVDAYVVFSESGYEYVTKSKHVNFVDYHNENIWTEDNRPDCSFNEKMYHHSGGYGGIMKYVCPFEEEWKDDRYLIRKDDGFYIVI